MIKGRFGNTSSAPFIEGLTVVTNQKKRRDISFLLDTGADKTMIMPLDGQLMGLDYTKLSRTCQNTGVGGTVLSYLENAIVTFKADGSLYTYKIDILIADPLTTSIETPSLLGRDIISRWRVNYDPAMNALECTVNAYDNIIGLKPPAAVSLREKRGF